MLKLVFLDIGGVRDYGYMTKEETLEVNNIGRMSSRAVRSLNSLTEDTRSKIVVTSTWRLDNAMPKTLNEFGITGEYLDSTPNLDSPTHYVEMKYMLGCR